MKLLLNGNNMNLAEFSNIIENFDPNHSKSSNELEKITKVYPYFQTAFFFHVKSLQHQENINFNDILEKNAILIYNRSILMNWINKKIEIKSNGTKNKNNVNEIIIAKKPKIKNEKFKSNNSKLRKLSFTEWITISHNNSLNHLQVNHEKNNDKWILINSFIENDNNLIKIDKGSSTSLIDLGSENNFSDEELMTETLAKIFIKQEKFDKALQAYKILSLKYPEKNSLFAIQIEHIKKIMAKNR